MLIFLKQKHNKTFKNDLCFYFAQNNFCIKIEYFQQSFIKINIDGKNYLYTFIILFLTFLSLYHYNKSFPEHISCHILFLRFCLITE